MLHFCFNHLSPAAQVPMQIRPADKSLCLLRQMDNLINNKRVYRLSPVSFVLLKRITQMSRLWLFSAWNNNYNLIVSTATWHTFVSRGIYVKRFSAVVPLHVLCVSISSASIRQEAVCIGSEDENSANFASTTSASKNRSACKWWCI